MDRWLPWRFSRDLWFKQWGPSCVVDDERHEQHGRISKLPAYQVTYISDWEDEHLCLKASGTVNDRTSKGYHVQLLRNVIVEGDKSIIRLHDQVTNLGIDAAPCMIKVPYEFWISTD